MNRASGSSAVPPFQLGVRDYVHCCNVLLIEALWLMCVIQPQPAFTCMRLWCDHSPGQDAWGGCLMDCARALWLCPVQRLLQLCDGAAAATAQQP